MFGFCLSKVIDLNKIFENAKITVTYLVTFLKWICISVLVGALGGLLGSAFHLSVDFATESRMEHPYLLLLLPVGGLVITWVYHRFRGYEHINTNLVIESVRDNTKIPIIMIPLIYFSTFLTHLFGGSAGREGAALQLGGSVGYNVGRLFRLKEGDMHIIVMSGMASVFSALFGTPVTAAIFSLEVVSVGTFNYAGVLPCIVASLTAYGIAGAFGIPPVRFDAIEASAFSFGNAARVVILSLLCAAVSILFCTVIEKAEDIFEKFFKNAYVRALSGAVIILALVVLLRTTDYNGAGMDVINRAMSGEARWQDFILKILFTAITISAGFKGGEIVPAFFVGSTFGCVMGAFLGINPAFGAAIGFVSLFCGVVNCPMASLILALEVFGMEGVLFFAVTCAVSYMMSGYYGLYRSQKIVYSKLDAHYIGMNAR